MSDIAKSGTDAILEVSSDVATSAGVGLLEPGWLTQHRLYELANPPF